MSRTAGIERSATARPRHFPRADEGGAKNYASRQGAGSARTSTGGVSRGCSCAPGCDLHQPRRGTSAGYPRSRRTPRRARSPHPPEKSDAQKARRVAEARGRIQNAASCQRRIAIGIRAREVLVGRPRRAAALSTTTGGRRAGRDVLEARRDGSRLFGGDRLRGITPPHSRRPSGDASGITRSTPRATCPEQPRTTSVRKAPAPTPCDAVVEHLPAPEHGRGRPGRRSKCHRREPTVLARTAKPYGGSLSTADIRPRRAREHPSTGRDSQRIVRRAPREPLHVHVIDPFAGIRAFPPEVLVHVGHRRRVRVDAGGAGREPLEERAPWSG